MYASYLALFFFNINPTETECPDDEVQVNCLVAPCDVTMCPAFPAARCVDDYCGSCRARFYVHGGEEVTANCQGGE